MNGYLVKDKNELIEKIEEIVSEGSKVACGGSMTLFEIGLIDYFRSGRYDFLEADKNYIERSQNVYNDLVRFSRNYQLTEVRESYDFFYT